jgi:hypothetical protein
VTRALIRAAIALGIVLVAAGPASAHQTAVKYLEVRVAGSDLQIEIRAQPSDVTRPLALADDATPSVDEALAGADRVAPYVRDWLAIRNAGAPCAAGPATVTRAAADARFLAVRWSVHCEAEVDELALDLGGFFAVDRAHEMLLNLTTPDADPYDTTIDADGSPLELTLSAERPSTLLAWIWQGMWHIYSGYDHVAFVLALLLVLAISRRPDGAWQVRPLWPALRATATVITAFTIAHSLTLIAASLGWLQLPIRFVEAMIAVSIAYTAIENIVKPDVRWRYLLTFAFGLIHGLGFASVLAVLLPPDQVVVPLLEFNLGVELGQLSIVVVALPLFAGIAWLIGAPRYRRIVLPILSGVIAVFGVKWTLERVFEISLPFLGL